jgi:hypothetical protein
MLKNLVGEIGFEPTTLWSQSPRLHGNPAKMKASQTWPVVGSYRSGRPS